MFSDVECTSRRRAWLSTHFNRDRIPERVVHAKGSGAYGTFTVTGDPERYTDSPPPIARRLDAIQLRVWPGHLLPAATGPEPAS